MKNYFQIFNNWDPDQIAALKSSGLSVSSGFQTIKVFDQELFNKLEPLFRRWGAMVTMGSEFSGRDYSDAHHLMILPDWQTQYPQPEGDFGFLGETYDLECFCSVCGVGAVQKGPFRLQKAIRWKRKNAFALHWVFDAIFVSTDAYERIFAPAGVGFFPVLLHKTGKAIEDVRQLRLEVAASALKLGDRRSVKCGSCGCEKYEPITGGYFPAFVDASYAPALVMSREYCGSGRSASKWVVVSQSFRKALLAEKMNFTFYPSEPCGLMSEK